MRVGIAGLGRMGRAIAESLAAAGVSVSVWNRTAGRADDLPNCRAAPALDDLVQTADTILTSLIDDVAVESVYDGLFAVPVAGKLFIETSTIRPETSQSLSARATALGADFVDAPIAGGPALLRAAQCLAFVGGTAAAAARARPVLERFCRRVEHIGQAGSGAAMKLVANLPLGVYFQAIAEALALGQGYGLDLERMLGILVDTPAGLPLLARKMPSILGAEEEVSFDIAGVRKDLLVMTASAQRAGVPMPAGTAALTGFAAATAAGWGARDSAQIVRFWQTAMAGRKPEKP
jgi:3-hydroxyisobutyrate dehydrogenase